MHLILHTTGPNHPAILVHIYDYMPLGVALIRSFEKPILLTAHHRLLPGQ